MSASRKERLSETLKFELFEVIRREMRDPRFSEGLLSITDVNVSQDLKYATVFVSVLGDEVAQKDILKALKGASGVIRSELCRRKAFKSVPELTFRYDEGFARGARVFSLIQQAVANVAVDSEEDLEAAKPPSDGKTG